MQSSIGSRVILESGPITNVLVALGLVDQISVANICRRTHQVTVPQFRAHLLLPIDPPCDFPNLTIPSDDFVCRRVETTIDGESGEFFGIVNKADGLPDGYGVFRTSTWAHCGKVKNGLFLEGRMVS